MLLKVILEIESVELLEAQSWLGLLPGPREPVRSPCADEARCTHNPFMAAPAHQQRYRPHMCDFILLQHEIVARPTAMAGQRRRDT